MVLHVVREIVFSLRLVGFTRMQNCEQCYLVPFLLAAHAIPWLLIVSALAPSLVARKILFGCNVSGLSLAMGAAAALLFPAIYAAGRARPADCDERTRFVHIPRTGGTSIEVWAKDRNFSWGAIESGGILAAWRQRWWAGAPWCNTWHIPPKYDASVSSRTPMLAAIRNPYERAVSQALYSGASCDGVDDFVRTRLSRFHAGERSLDDCHWLPQHEYVTDSRGALFENIVLLRAETLHTDFASFCGSASSLPHANAHRKHTECHAHDAVAHGVGRAGAHHGDDGHASLILLLQNETRRMLHETWKDDFILWRRLQHRPQQQEQQDLCLRWHDHGSGCAA